MGTFKETWHAKCKWIERLDATWRASGKFATTTGCKRDDDVLQEFETPWLNVQDRG